MPYLSNLEHTDKNIQEKINYFSDYFNFVNIRIGSLKELQFENHLSLIEKCIYQLENNFQKSTYYLDNYLSNCLLDSNEFLNLFRSTSICYCQIREYLGFSKQKERKKWIIDNSSFLVNLKKLREELNQYMISVVLKELISFLQCKHNLNKHIKLIEYYTNILVSEFFFRGFTKKEIERVIALITSNNINDFPISIEIHNQKNKENYKQILNDFFKNRNLSSQFYGIKNLFDQEKKEAYFIFKIYNISSEEFDDFKFNYDKVTFLSPNHIELNFLDGDKKKRNILKGFLGDRNDFILAYSKSKYINRNIEAKKLLKVISLELKFLNMELGSNGIIDDSMYLYTRGFIDLGFVRQIKSKVKLINTSDLSDLKYNLFAYLIKLPKNIKAPLEFFEHEFMEAYREKDVSLLWKYLENLIPLNENGEKQVKSVVSNILILNVKEFFKETLKFDFSNTISVFSIGHIEIGLTSEEQYEIERNYGSLNPLLYEGKIERPFIKKIINTYKEYAFVEDLNPIKDYYNSLLIEAYELRNMKIHRGVVNPKVEMKLQSIFPDLVLRFRNILVKECSTFIDLNFDEMILNLNIKGKELLNKNRQ